MNNLKLEKTLKEMEIFFNKLGIKEKDNVPSVDTLVELLENNPSMIEESMNYINKFQKDFKEINALLHNKKR